MYIKDIVEKENLQLGSMLYYCIMLKNRVLILKKHVKLYKQDRNAVFRVVCLTQKLKKKVKVLRKEEREIFFNIIQKYSL